MAKPKYIEIEKDGQKGKCLPSSLPAWERNGWTAVDDGTSTEKDEEPTEDAPVEVVNSPLFFDVNDKTEE
jgi:hypothetical protein